MLTPTRARVGTTPHWMIRRNLFPYTPLRAAAPDDRLGELAAEDARRARIADGIVAALEAEIPRLPDGPRRAALAAKRAVYRGDPVRPADADALAAAVPALAEWETSWEASRAAAARVDGAEAAGLAAERRLLRDWAADADVQRSIAVTSTALFTGVTARAASDALDRRARKSEPTLVQYHSRSTVRVSPFSRYTAVGIRGADDPTDAGGPTSRVALKRLVVRHGLRRVLADSAVRSVVRWRMPADATIADGVLRLGRLEFSPPDANARLDAYTEQEVRWPIPAGWEPVVRALRGHAAAKLDALTASVAARTGADAGKLRPALERLAEAGILIPIPPVAEQEPDYERRLARAIADWPGDAAAGLRRALDETARATAAFEDAGAAERVELTRTVSAAWSPVTGTECRAPLVEDVIAPPHPGEPALDLERAAGLVGDLAPLWLALDDQRMLALALEAVFVERHGAGGTCTDLREFARHTARAFPIAAALLADGPADDAIGDTAAGLRAARRRASAHLVELGRRGGEEQQIDPDALDEIDRLLPETERAAPRPLAVFAQPGGGRLVVNHVYGGRLRYFSRYLPAVEPAVTDALRAELAAEAGEALTVHLRPTLGFNANLSPLLAEAELALDDEPTAPDAGRHPPVALDDLVLTHDGGGLRLRHTPSGRDVHPLYTGFLVPHALPGPQMLLAMLAGAPYFGFGDLAVELHRRGMQARAPRIVHEELVLFRRRWAIAADELLPAAGETTAEHYRRIDLVRRRRGIPDQVFLRALHGERMSPMERATAPKPQHHDFLSRLHALGIRKRLADLGDTLLSEEFEPEPGIGEHAAEVFFEVRIGGSTT